MDKFIVQTNDRKPMTYRHRVFLRRKVLISEWFLKNIELKLCHFKAADKKKKKSGESLNFAKV